MTLTMIICMKLVRNKLDDTLEDVENTFYYTKWRMMGITESKIKMVTLYTRSFFKEYFILF